MQIGQKDSSLENLLITSNDLDTLYHIISEKIEEPDIKNLLEQRLSTNKDVNLVEQMFKIQIAMFCKKGPFAVMSDELRDELSQIKQTIAEKFSSDLENSSDVITKWSENDQNKENFLLSVLNSCES
ncbi:MAG: hypothetical protein K8Q89_06355 [Nitrosarchaeum sp.]|nr:hypothetical protein [Nitrosarchaeum sp.]